jgi:superfamily II DNA or RNA helicase
MDMPVSNQVTAISPEQRFLRPWQIKLIQVCRAMSPDRPVQILIDVVPAGGKGAVPYLLSAHMPRAVASAVCHVVPRINLGTQAELPAANIKQYLAVVGIRQPVFRYTQNTERMLRGYDGYSVCQNSVCLNPDLHCHEFTMSGQGPFMLVLDEPQMLPADGLTQNAVNKLRASKGCGGLVMMSGTLYRGDRKAIPFLPYKKDEDGKEILDRESPEWQVISYNRKEALENHDILPLEFKKHDAKAELYKGGTIQQFESLRELKDYQDQRDGLYAVLSSEAGWEIVRATLDDWVANNRRYQTTQCLIVTHSQAQAKHYRKLIQRAYAGLNVYVATSDEEQAADILKEFRKSQGDVLITVGMAYVGFDAPRISHIALLTYYRNRTWIEQALARGVRVDAAIPYAEQRCRAFVPWDPLLIKIISAIEVEQAEALALEGGGGGSGVERDFVYAIHSNVTESQAHELNSVKLDADMTKFFARLRHNIGATVSDIGMHDALIEAAIPGTVKRPYAKEPPEIGVSDMEKMLSAEAQNLCSQIDYMRNAPFGTTNAERCAANSRSRTGMAVPELIKELEVLRRIKAHFSEKQKAHA